MVFYTNPLHAQTESAAAAGTAVSAGITTGTIVTGVILAAAVAAAIAASGGGVSEEFIPTKTAEQKATENLQQNTSTSTQSSTSQVALTLNSNEIANLGTAASSTLGKSFSVTDPDTGTSKTIKASEALSATTGGGVKVNDVQLALNATSNPSNYLTPGGNPLPTGAFTPFLTPSATALTQDAYELYLYLLGLRRQDQTAYNAFSTTLQSIAARNSQDAINAVQALNANVEADIAAGKTSSADAVAAVLKDAQANYAAMMETMLAALHPGYYATVVHKGNNVYVTTLHKKQ